MSIPTIEEYNLDPQDPILRDADKAVCNGYWYLGATGTGAKTAWGGNGAQIENQEDDSLFKYYGDGTALRCKLNKNGTIKGSITWDTHPKASGVWRQPFGWDNNSVQNRAPEVYKLFQYINDRFLEGKFAINGFGEENGGTRPMWSEKFGEDDSIPGYGTLPSVGNPPGIWTAYCTGKAGGVLMENPRGTKPRRAAQKMPGSAGLHRDAPVINEVDGKDYYSLVVILNPTWKPSWEGGARYHETLDPHSDECEEIHWKRGYGIGHAISVHPQKPGRVYLVPSTAIHSGYDLFMPDRPHYQRRLLFRIKKIGSPHYVAPNITCGACDWVGVVPASKMCPTCGSGIDTRLGWEDPTWVEDISVGERNPESKVDLSGDVTDSTKSDVSKPRNER